MTIIPDTKITHQLLYTPYSRDYHVSAEIVNLMTENEFFDKCYVAPDFKVEEKRICESSEAEEKDYIDEAYDGYQFTVEYELINERKRIKNYITSYTAFKNWINDNGNGVYCIKGDAGTGKTTFLHHLEYNFRSSELRWEIIDLQDAIDIIKIYSQEITIHNFRTLKNKIISCLLINIFSLYMPNYSNEKKLLEHLENLYLKYLENRVILYQITEVKWFFDDAEIFKPLQDGNNENRIENFIRGLCNNIQKFLDTSSSYIIIDRLMDVYMTILRAINPNVKHILAFDNIERFIKSHEIFNSEIDDFVEKLRHISDSFLQRDQFFLNRFQFVILMRNTSSRMSSIPLQLIDFGGHDLDISGWFPVDRIISKKIRWYNNKRIPLDKAEIIDTIIGDNCFDGHGIRSLQEKMGSLLNRDKRIIVNMLDRAIDYAQISNPPIISVYYDLIKMNKRIKSGFAKFAARSIIIRTILDVFQDDNFFKLIRTQSQGSSFERLSYSRKILTILYDYSISNPNSIYMAFKELITQLIGEKYFDSNNQSLRKTISSILYTMNYYNRRSNNWFRLIDIQYNLQEGSCEIKNSDDLEKILYQHPDETGFKIMEAGVGYLKYIVQSFEYFSCRYSKNYLPPLMCLVPNQNELEIKEAVDFECYGVISCVKKEAISCIEYIQMNQSSDLPFRRQSTERGISHINRIINSHTGYIGNFMGFVREYYNNCTTLSDNQREKIDHLDNELGKIINEYNKYRCPY